MSENSAINTSCSQVEVQISTVPTKPAIDMGTGRGTLSVPFEYLINIAKAAKPSEFTKSFGFC